MQSIWRGLFASFLGLCALPLVSAPPPQQPSETPKFQSQTELVLVPTIVQRGGKHVGGLKKEDFTILQEGKPQSVAVFEEIHATHPRRGELAPAEFGNERADPGAGGDQVTVIAIDTENTAPLNQTYAREQIERFVTKAAETGEPFGLVAITRGGIRVLHDFTTDTRSLLAALRKAKGEPSATPANAAVEQALRPEAVSLAPKEGEEEKYARQLQQWQALQDAQDRFTQFQASNARRDTLASFLQLAHFLSGFRGRKNVVWVSDGLDIFGGIIRTTKGTDRSMSLSGIGTAFDQSVYTLQVLSAANIAVYPVDARHGANASFETYDVSNKYSALYSTKEEVRQRDQDAITSFQKVAAATGGKPCFNRTDLDNCFREAVEDAQAYYLLGFYVDRQKTKPGWHPLAVKLNQKADVRAREGFISGAPNTEQARLTDFQLAMSSPVEFTALPFSGSFGAVEDKGGKKAVSFALQIPPGAAQVDAAENRLNVDIAVVARSIGGKEAGKMAQRIDRKLTPEQAAMIAREGIRYTNRIEVTAGQHGFWIVVRDNNSGRVGSALTTFEVR